MLFIPGLITVVIVAIDLVGPRYVNAKPNEVVVITGLRSSVTCIGKAGT